MNKAMLIGSMLGVATLGFSGNSLMAKPDTRNRAEIPAKYRWDFSAIYPTIGRQARAGVRLRVQ